MEIRIEDVTFSYNSVPTIENVSFAVKEGELLSVLGPNGSGKTTLLKVISSLLTPRTGAIYLDGKHLKDLSLEERAKLIGYVPQRSESPNLTVFEAVLSGRKPHMGFRVKNDDIVITEEVLKLMGLSHLRGKPITRISGGEFQKVIIARALAQRPKVLLLDEPLSHLDVKNQFEIASLIRNSTREFSLITITVLHDINLALRFSDLFLLMKGGRVEAIGGREIINRDTILNVFGIEGKIEMKDGLPYVFF